MNVSPSIVEILLFLRDKLSSHFMFAKFLSKIALISLSFARYSIKCDVNSLASGRYLTSLLLIITKRWMCSTSSAISWKSVESISIFLSNSQTFPKLTSKAWWQFNLFGLPEGLSHFLSICSSTCSTVFSLLSKKQSSGKSFSVFNAGQFWKKLWSSISAAIQMILFLADEKGF